MMMLNSWVLHWSVEPEIFTIAGGRFGLRYYSLFWALSFILGFYLLQAIFKNEQRSFKDLDSLFIITLLGTILGARIGHCLFYDFRYYFIENPIKILYVWEGGLASHGGLLGILIALWLFVRKRPKFTYMWVLDRLTIPIALGSAFIRTGNFFNSEIVGSPTNGNWGVIFARLGEDFPRVPVQLFEGACYYVIFFILFRYYWKHKGQFPPGIPLGFFFVTVFGSRFLLEFWKAGEQVAMLGFELNRGHWLSIPVIIVGLVILIQAYRNKAARASS